MYKPLMICMSMLLSAWAVSGCGNRGDLFLSPDVRLAQELDNVSERIGDGTSPDDSTQVELPETDDESNNAPSTGKPGTDETDETKPDKKPQP